MNRFHFIPSSTTNGNNAFWLLLLLLLLLIARYFINYFCFSCMSSWYWFAKFCNKFLFSFSVESIVQIPAINSTHLIFLQFPVLIQTVNIWLYDCQYFFMNSVFRVGSSIIYFRYNCSFFEEFKSKLMITFTIFCPFL
jgi:hypothetical protein